MEWFEQQTTVESGLCDETSTCAQEATIDGRTGKVSLLAFRLPQTTASTQADFMSLTLELLKVMV